MGIGLEVFDENGVKILGMDKSIIRIIKVLDRAEYFQWQQTHPNIQHVKIFSCFIDFDVHADEIIPTDTSYPFKWIWSLFDKVLIGVINVSN